MIKNPCLLFFPFISLRNKETEYIVSLQINHIVNNAGFTNDKMLHNIDDATFQQMLDCHTIAPFRLIRAAAPYMRIKEPEKRENRSVIFVSSDANRR